MKNTAPKVSSASFPNPSGCLYGVLKAQVVMNETISVSRVIQETDDVPPFPHFVVMNSKCFISYCLRSHLQPKKLSDRECFNALLQWVLLQVKGEFKRV